MDVRKALRVLVLLMLVALGCGCGKSPSFLPRNSAEAYLRAQVDGDFNRAAAMLRKDVVRAMGGDRATAAGLAEAARIYKITEFQVAEPAMVEDGAGRVAVVPIIIIGERLNRMNGKTVRLKSCVALIAVRDPDGMWRIQGTTPGELRILAGDFPQIAVLNVPRERFYVQAGNGWEEIKINAP